MRLKSLNFRSYFNKYKISIEIDHANKSIYWVFYHNNERYCYQITKNLSRILFKLNDTRFMFGNIFDVVHKNDSDITDDCNFLNIIKIGCSSYTKTMTISYEIKNDKQETIQSDVLILNPKQTEKFINIMILAEIFEKEKKG